MAKKSHRLGGTRTSGRHVGELGAGGALALLLVSFVPEGMLDPFQMNLSGVVLTGAFSTLAKVMHEGGALKKILKLGLVTSLIAGLTGCAGFAGTSSPEFQTGGDGETIVACDVKGVGFAFGSASICRNVEGGHVGRDFVNLFTSVASLASSLLGGIFTGFGAVGQAISAAPQPAMIAPVIETPAVVYESDTDTGADMGPNWFGE